MELKDFIRQIVDTLPKDKNIGITFELGLMSDGKTINDASKNRVKFSITNKLNSNINNLVKLCRKCNAKKHNGK